MLTLYNPPVSYYSKDFVGVLPVLSLAYLSAVLNRAGVETNVIDLEAMRITPEQFGKMGHPSTIGFTCLAPSVKGMNECIKALRQNGYKGKIVLGGPHLTVHPYGWDADLVVTGECEGNILELLDTSGIQVGLRMPIDDIPLPDWEHYTPDITTYKGQYRWTFPRAGVSMWTRGCPYSCIYCSDVIFNHQPKRYRKPESIEREMKYLKDRGINKVYVYDDEVIGSRAPEGWMKEVADRLEPLEMQWMAQARCSRKYVTREVLEDAKRAGCRVIQWGVESFSPHVLEAVHKHTTPEDIWHSLKTAKEVGIKNAVFTMIGSYQETEEDVKITAKALEKGYRERLIDFRQTFVCQVMEGTELERLAKEEGWYKAPAMGGAYMKAGGGTPWLSSKTIQDYRAVYNTVCPVPQP